MEGRVRALLVYADGEPSQSLDLALQNLKVEVCRARTCQEAWSLVRVNPEPPDIIFTDARLPDGSWEELLGLARGMGLPPKIIVVARVEDPRFYLQAMEDGAFDFMLPPFESAGLAHVIRCATDYSRGRSVSANAV
jgi:DNA-binding NtrC family response regulator